MANARKRAADGTARAHSWVGETSGRRSAFDFGVKLVDRDRDAFASVLGSAIALRLFLFAMGFIVVAVTLLNLLLGDGVAAWLSAGGVSGELAGQVEAATTSATGRDIGFLISGLILSLSAGRSLTKVLAACSAGAWRIDARDAKASIRTMARISGMVALFFVTATLVSRLRASHGIAVATGTMAINMAVIGVGWFFVTLALPRTTRDPGSVLPGAIVFAVVMTSVQWVMYFYLPLQVSNASEVMGSVGVTVASLGYLFLIGRVMAGCIVFNAVLFEELGSVSDFIFGLPGVRRIPARFPKLFDYFDLGPGAPAPPVEPGA